MPTVKKHEPHRNFNYEVSFVGKKQIFNSGWSAVSKITMQNNYTEYREGGNNGVADQIHTETIYQPVVMQRGVLDDTSLLEAISGQWDKSGKGIMNKDRYQIIIKVKARDNKTVIRTITLKEAWFIGFETSDLVALGSEVYMDAISVAFKDVSFS